MAYVGTPIDTRNTFQSLQGKRFNGDGSTTAFTLDVAPSSTLDIEVFVGNVRQDPNSAYTLSGTTFVTYTHLRAHETKAKLVCRLLLEKKKKQQHTHKKH